MIRRVLVAAVTVAALVPCACSATGSHHLSCASTEVAPNTQPGASGPKAALTWFLEHGNSDLPRNGFHLEGHSKTRYVYANGARQVSVGALPAEKGQPRTWVVLMTYDCT